MNKQHFMTKLRYELLSLPEREREDILQEYDAHFEFGKQQGRTEEEIARELGVPEELAQELRGNGEGNRSESRYEQPSFGQFKYEAPRYDQPGYGQQRYAQSGYEQPRQDMRGQGSSYMPPPPPMQGGFAPPYPPQGHPYYDTPAHPRGRSAGGQLLMIIMLSFFSLITIPLLISGWAVLISLVAVAVALIVLPAIYVFKLAIGGPFYGGELSLVAIAFGLGLLFAQFVAYLFKMYGLLNVGYGKWMAKLVRGGA